MRIRRALAIALLMLCAGAATPVLAQTYPMVDTLEFRDSNGNLLNEHTPTCPADGVSVKASGWLANSDVRGTFFSTPVDLGSHRAGSDGIVSFTFRIENVENGLHTLRLSGTGRNGQPRTVEATILCECKVPGSAGGQQPVAVLGQTLDNAANGKTDTGGAFGKTGMNATTAVMLALDLLVVGFVLRLAATRSRREKLRLG